MCQLARQQTGPGKQAGGAGIEPGTAETGAAESHLVKAEPGDNVIKLFLSPLTLLSNRLVRSFLKFTRQAQVCPTQGLAQSLTHTRPKKRLSRTNTLAYLFRSPVTKRLNKLEHLVLASLSSFVLKHASKA